MIVAPGSVTEILEELAYIRGKAPDRFREGESLAEAFRAVTEGVDNSSAEMGSPEKVRRTKAMCHEALLAYARGNLKQGDALLDAIEDELTT